MIESSQTPKESIIIYTSKYMAPSEVWIGRHVDGLARYEPLVCCLKKVNAQMYHGERVVELRSQSYIKRRFNQLLYFLLLKGWPRSADIPIWKLEQQVVQNNPKLIHVHFLWNGLIPLNIKKMFNIPVIFTAHGSDVNRARVDRGYKLYLQNIVFKQASKIMAVSKFIQYKLMALGCSPDKVCCHYLGAPLPVLTQREYNANKKIRIGCVASFNSVKGQAYLIDAFHNAFNQNPRLHLTLVGDGAERRNLEQQIKRLDLEKHVELTGWLSPQEVNEVLQKIDIYAQMSLAVMKEGDKRTFSEEGLPISMVEAAGHGLPIIGTDSGGISEICRDGVNGFLIPERDVNAMAEALAKLAGNFDMCRSMGWKSREIVEQEFNADKQMEKLEQFYDQVVAQSEGCQVTE